MRLMTRTEALTRRELEVMDRLAHHPSDQEIADALGISINTIKHHLRNIYAKLGVSNRRRALEEFTRLSQSTSLSERLPTKLQVPLLTA